MKKLLISTFFSVFLVTSASADIGVNIGVSANSGLFAASAHEKYTGGKTNGGSEHGAAAWGSIFIEKTSGDILMVGIDYVPSALETDTTETAKSDKRTAGSNETITASTNKIQIDFEDMTTYYVGARFGDLFAKAGIMTVEVITNENLETGGKYGDSELDGHMFGVGYNRTADNGAFVRFEGNYMSFDGITVKNGSDTEKSIKLKQLDGVSGKVSIGKSF